MFATAVARGADYAASRAALPVNYETSGEPDGAPSYVNVHAVSESTVVSVEAGVRGGKLEVEISMTVLEGLRSACTAGLGSEFAVKYLNWALQQARFRNSSVSDIRVQ